MVWTIAFVVICLGGFVGALAWTAHRATVENDQCESKGGVMVRGFGIRYVCVRPIEGVR